MTQKKGKIFKAPSCSSQTLEGLLWEGFHSTANKPTLHLPSVSEKHTHYSAASFILFEHYQPPPHFLSQLWSEPGLSADQILKICVTLGTSFTSLVSPTSIPKWKRLWALFRSKALWRLRAKRDKPCEFRISSLERPHQETGTESQLSTRALLFPPKEHNLSPGGSRRPGSDARSRPCTALASPAGDPTPAHPPPRPPAGDPGGRPHPSPPPAPTADFLEVPGRAGQAAFTNQLYAARVETSLTPRGPRSPPVRPPAGQSPVPAPPPRPPPDPGPLWPPAEPCGPEPRNLALPATEARTSLPTFGALFNSRINSLRRRRKDPRGTRRCPESCPAGAAQGPMGIRSSARRFRQHFLPSEDHISQKDARERLGRWVGTRLANQSRVPCLYGRKGDRERESAQKRRKGGADSHLNQSECKAGPRTPRPPMGGARGWVERKRVGDRGGGATGSRAGCLGGRPRKPVGTGGVEEGGWGVGSAGAGAARSPPAR